MANPNDQKITVSAEKLAHDALRDLATALWREHHLILVRATFDSVVAGDMGAVTPRLFIREVEIETRTVPHAEG